MQQLKKQIKEKQIQGIYLFYGEEHYILNAYLDKAVDSVMIDSDRVMNLDVFEAQGNQIDKMIDAMDTLPFLGEKRVVVMKSLELFQAKNASKTEKLIEALSTLPSTTVLFIVENEVDKRTKLFKKINSLGRTIEFNRLSEDDLVQYIADQLNKHNKKIEKVVAKHFIHTVGFDLATIHNELDKLVAYNKESDIVSKQTIDEICTKSVENRIFDLVDCMGGSRRQHALKLYNDLVVLREPPTRVLFMLTRQFRLILQTKLMLEKGAQRQEMASKLKLPPFVLDKNMKQAKNFSIVQLKEALKQCLDAEVQMKTGKMDITLGIELLIIKYSA
ncbi:MAG: DNA polymerase III subunit delta [Firmicutes bacterium HGW-Firmicutes-1]|jgi:DNA polymerase-3 subunit delta|nr:MAG: DNA polymerase III subunit delta [Firmicutes bacterium HGW-Firmicutes-1]